MRHERTILLLSEMQDSIFPAMQDVHWNIKDGADDKYQKSF